MKSITLLAITALFGTCTLAIAKDKHKHKQKHSKHNKHAKHQFHKVPHGNHDKWDTDSDGKISDEERETVREEQHRRMLERYDTDEDGRLSEVEREWMHEAMEDRRRRLLERYDVNVNGRLDPDEATEARRDGEEVPY